MPEDVDTLLRRYNCAVPRYTSYPTAPHFTPTVGAQTYAGWLAELPRDTPLSLYLHVPFCDQLCLFCACHTTVVHGDGPKEAYGRVLESEIALLARHLGARHRVAHIHWGGGTPSALPAASARAVNQALATHFTITDATEIAVEVDPRTLPPDRLEALAALGMTRASIGVQDFDPSVQQAIGRIQSYEVTRDCAARLRASGVSSINLDLIYGLPRQTIASVAETARRAASLAPDRIAVFGYAHVPWIKRHQRLMPEEALPGARARYAQQEAIHAVLEDAGYQPIGFDHFARPGDRLTEAAANGGLHRNFQGYTADDAPVLLGLGASAIGTLPQGYTQNAAKIPTYLERVRAGRLPITRGVACTGEDRMRRRIIETLMCTLSVNLDAIAAENDTAVPISVPEAALREMAADRLIRWNGAQIDITPRGRPFVRVIAALFDTYWDPNTTGHSAAI